MRASFVSGVVSMSSGESSAPAVNLPRRAEYRTLAARRTLETGSHLGQMEPQLRHGAAERVAVHSQLFGRLTLVSPVRQQNFAQVLLLELRSEERRVGQEGRSRGA